MRQPPENLLTGRACCASEAEAGQQRRRARARAVAAGVERCAARRVCRAVVVRRRRRERALDRAQLAIAVEHVVERGVGTAGVSWATCAMRPSRRQSMVAGVGRELAANRREQARLARAVRADEADLVPVVHRQRRVVEQALRPAGQREIRDPQHVSHRSSKS